MPPKRAPRSRSRQTTPQSPPKQSASTSSPRQSKRATRSRSHEAVEQPVRQKRPEQPLPAVEEEIQSEDEEIVEPHPPSNANAVESVVAVDSSVSDDDIDDTSSNGTTQLEALDTDLIIDGLPGLYQVTKQILSLFDSKDPLDLVKEINQTISRTSKRLRHLLTVFNASREVFGNGTYIDIPIILRKLTAGRDADDGPWKPDAIFQLANLSLLIANLSQRDETIIYDTLERMFNSFPEPFGQFILTVGRTTYSTESVEATVSFGTALRTQFFLSFVQKSKESLEFDPDAILEKVFFDEDGNINGFQVEGEDISLAAQDTILKRISDIRNYFEDSSVNPVDIAGLKHEYPWQDFLVDTIKWTLLRRKELENQIIAKGGLEAIKERLEQNDFSPYNDRTPYTQATPEIAEPELVEAVHNAPKQTPNTRGAGPAVVGASTMAKRAAQLMNIKAKQAEESSEESEDEEESDSAIPSKEATRILSQDTRAVATEIPQSPEAVALGSDVDQVGDDDDFVDQGGNEVSEMEEQIEDLTPPRPTQGSIVPTQKTLAVLEVAREQEALSNKENINTTRRLFIDKQDNAKRLEWNDSQPGQKRTREVSDQEDEESDDYETDNRPSKRVRHQRAPLPNAADDWIEADAGGEVEGQASLQTHGDTARSAGVSSSQPPPNRRSHQQRERTLASRPPPSSAPELQTQRAKSSRRQFRHQSMSPIDSSPERRSTVANNYANANAEAKATMRLRTLLNPPTTQRLGQTRRAWTVSETNRLFEMIATYGCAWARILTQDVQHPEGPELQSRTQVQLKDKARNLKTDYLKAGMPLPEGFAAVTIKKSDKQLLEELGLPYE